MAAAAAAAGLARADGLGGSVEPGYSHSEGTSTDSTGRTSSISSDAFTQRYRLSLGRSITDILAVGADGSLSDDHAWTRTDGVWSESRFRSTLIGARLTLGGPVLSATAGAERREQAAAPATDDPLVSESVYLNAQWRPLALPDLQLRLAHLNAYDRLRLLRDGTTDSAEVSTRYSGTNYEVRYLLSWGRDTDRLHLSETSAVGQTATGHRSDVLLGGRTQTYVSATVQTRDATTAIRGAGATITRQQVASIGLSAVVALPATAADVALAPNPQLIDGATGAPAAVNLGWGLAATGDRNPREVGAGFANVTTDVNTIYVWFDRSVSRDVGAALAGTLQVWASDDNQSWNPVQLVGAPFLSPFDSRIEIGIVQTRARYLKVDLRPVAAGLTTDTAVRDLFVSEVQFLLVLPAALVPRSESEFGVSGTLMARTLVLRRPNLSYDLAASAAYQDATSRASYDLMNGLSATERLGATRVTATARGARRDTSDGLTHLTRWEWSAGLAGQPIPTASWSLTYAGNSDRDRIVHSISGFGRADWYEGISSQVSAGAARSTTGARVADTFHASAGATLAPNRFVTLTAGALYSRNFVSDPELGGAFSHTARVEGSVSLRPTPAIAAAATVSDVLFGGVPSTYATFYLTYAPLRGDLQLSVAYSKVLDVLSRASTTTFTPTLHWLVRPGVTLNAYYTLSEVSSPAVDTRMRTLGTTLLILL